MAEQKARSSSSNPAVLLGITAGALVVLGLVMILSASSVTSFTSYGSSFYFFKRQLLWAAVGATAFLIFAAMDYRGLKGWGYGAYLFVVALLVAVLLPGVGVMAGGSVRWLDLGPLSFQPSELAKLALILFAADILSRKPERSLNKFSHTLIPLMPAIGLLTLLVMLQPDLGTAVLLGAICLCMLFVAGAPAFHLIPIAATAAAAGAVLALSEDYRRARILAFQDPWRDPLNTGYQAIQSLIAMGSGGWFGVGLGASRQKWSYIPNAHTDFIYAILGEEMGLFGTLLVLGLFAFLTYLGVRTARRSCDRFGMMMASGITIWIALQALVNIGAVTATLPITGVPLPLVSFGGSSLVVSMAALGILTSIARHSKPLPKRTAARGRAGRPRIAEVRTAVTGLFDKGREAKRRVGTAADAAQRSGARGAHRAHK